MQTLLREEGDCYGLGQGGMFHLKHMTAGLLGTGTGSQLLKCLVCFSESLLCLFIRKVSPNKKQAMKTLNKPRVKQKHSLLALCPGKFIFGSKVEKLSYTEQLAEP